MRFAIICVCVFILIGCVTNESMDKFGRGDQTGKCKRTSLNTDWGMDITPAIGFQSSVNNLEVADNLIFPWGNILTEIAKTHFEYVKILKHSKKITEEYNNCNIEQDKWEFYWHEVAKCEYKFWEIKNILANRLGYLLGKERLSLSQSGTIISVLNYLKNDIKLAGPEFLKNLEHLEKKGYIKSYKDKNNLKNSSEKFSLIFASAIKEKVGSFDFHGDIVLERIKSLNNIMARISK